MAKYRKKPIVIEAFQTTERVVISTLEGDMVANAGDWIITGVKGEQYPCKPDIFAATYESADKPDSAARVRELEAEREKCVEFLTQVISATEKWAEVGEEYAAKENIKPNTMILIDFPAADFFALAKLNKDARAALVPKGR